MDLRSDIIDLYSKYGFDNSETNDQYLVFLSQQGYFQNAEIVVIDKNFKDVDSVIKEYSSIGYSVRTKNFNDLETIHEDLFKGFFYTDMSNKKIQREYDQFCLQQKHKLAGYDYQYVSSPFIENGFLNTSDTNILERVLNIFNNPDRQLIILEASAGYGKTSTSFEIIKSITENMPQKISLLAELSKNRKASVFRYVLLSEIDQKFPALPSDLVTEEIKNGRIILIIDGFDELLSKDYSSQQEKDSPSAKEAQTMLDTIVQLIPENSNTKILLTSRKSSIFAGENFDRWLSEHHIDNCVTRIQISQPSIKDWLGEEKIDALNANNINLKNILNPVLLTILKKESISSFKEKFTSNEELIKQYLTSLLDREKERQALPLEVSEQLSIMYRLAAQMVRYDISSDDIEAIKMLLLDVIQPDLEEYLKRYDILPDSPESKPDESSFLTKLSHHALLDRTSSQNNTIGFINEFIFGIMISQAVLNKHLNPNELTGKYLEIAVTAYSTYSDEEKRKMYELISPHLLNGTASQKITTSMSLINAVVDNFEGEYFDSIIFDENIIFSNSSYFKNCMFVDCIFQKNTITTNMFKECQFYKCSFYDVNITSNNIEKCNLTFLECSGSEEFDRLSNSIEIPEASSSIDFNRVILEQFWKPGSSRSEPNRAYTALLKGASPNDRQARITAIEYLTKENILIKRNRVYDINFERMETILKILGRKEN